MINCDRCYYLKIITLGIRPITYCQHNKMDWNKCILCQDDGGELLYPLRNKNQDIDSYSKLAYIIDQYVNECLLLHSKVQADLKELDFKSLINRCKMVQKLCT